MLYLSSVYTSLNLEEKEKLLDLTGRLVLCQPIYTNNHQVVDLTEIKQGIHIIQVMNMNNKTYTAKIIIP